MKKVLLLLVVTLFTASTVFSQDDKKVKFGLKITPGLSWLRPDNTKDMEGGGAGLTFAWGGAAEINLGDNAAIVLGLEQASYSAKINYLDTAGYYFDANEGQIREVEDNGLPSDTSGALSFIQLSNRQFKATYIRLPFAIKAKTNEIGYLTYFGQLGIDTHINTKGRANDELSSQSGVAVTNEDLKDLDIDSEITPVKFNLSIGAGAEYNLQGSTSLVFSINYIAGLTNVVRGDSRHLAEPTSSSATGAQRFSQKLSDGAITLGIGILF